MVLEGASEHNSLDPAEAPTAAKEGQAKPTQVYLCVLYAGDQQAGKLASKLVSWSKKATQRRRGHQGLWNANSSSELMAMAGIKSRSTLHHKKQLLEEAGAFRFGSSGFAGKRTTLSQPTRELLDFLSKATTVEKARALLTKRAGEIPTLAKPLGSNADRTKAEQSPSNLRAMSEQSSSYLTPPVHQDIRPSGHQPVSPLTRAGEGQTDGALLALPKGQGNGTAPGTLNKTTPEPEDKDTTSPGEKDEHAAAAKCGDDTSLPQPPLSAGRVSCVVGEDGFRRYKGPHEQYQIKHPSEQPKNGMAEEWRDDPGSRKHLQKKHEAFLVSWYDDRNLSDFAKLQGLLEAQRKAEQKAKHASERAKVKAAQIAAANMRLKLWATAEMRVEAALAGDLEYSDLRLAEQKLYDQKKAELKKMAEAANELLTGGHLKEPVCLPPPTGEVSWTLPSDGCWL